MNASTILPKRSPEEEELREEMRNIIEILINQHTMRRRYIDVDAYMSQSVIEMNREGENFDYIVHLPGTHKNVIACERALSSDERFHLRSQFFQGVSGYIHYIYQDEAEEGHRTPVVSGIIWFDDEEKERTPFFLRDLKVVWKVLSEKFRPKRTA